MSKQKVSHENGPNKGKGLQDRPGGNNKEEKKLSKMFKNAWEAVNGGSKFWTVIWKTLWAFVVGFGLYYLFGRILGVLKWGWPVWAENLTVLGASLFVLAVIGFFVEEKPRLGKAIIVVIILLGVWDCLKEYNDKNFDSEGNPLKWVNLTTWEVTERPRAKVLVLDKGCFFKILGSDNDSLRFKAGDKYWIEPKNASVNVQMTSQLQKVLSANQGNYRVAKSGLVAGSGLVPEILNPEKTYHRGDTTIWAYDLPANTKLNLDMLIGDSKHIMVINKEDLKITCLVNGRKRMFVLMADDENANIPWRPISCYTERSQKLTIKTWSN